MKKILLFVFSLTINYSAFSQYEGFENWTSTSILKLNDYESGAIEGISAGVITTYPSTDSYIGAKSIKMETFLTPNNDTLFGYFLTGDPNNMKPGQAVTLTDVDSLVGYYKSNLLPNDSSIILCEIFKSGLQQGGGLFYLKGIQSTWKRFAFPIQAPMADSLLLAIAGGNPLDNFPGIPGSWLMVDNIQLKAANGSLAPIANHSFENWTTLSIDQPTNWSTSNIFAVGSSLMPAVKSNDFYSGAYSLELNTISSNQGDTLPGYATNGPLANNSSDGGQPYSLIPTGLSLYYKYAPSNGDIAYANIKFKKNGVILGDYGTSFASASSFTSWSSVVSITQPDTVLITFTSGNNPGSKLKIDHIDFSIPIGQSEYLNIHQIISYPNPVKDVINIKYNLSSNSIVTIRLIDVTGKEIDKKLKGNLSSGEYSDTFHTSTIISGIYFLEFTVGNEVTKTKIIIQ